VGGIFMLALSAFISATTIVISFPTYDIILREAFPQVRVVSLAEGVSDPHKYRLTVADVELLCSLNKSDVLVLTMHAPFELKMAEMAKSGGIKAKVIDLTKVQLYLTNDGRLTTFSPGVNLHDHGVPNVLRLVEAVSKTTSLSPGGDFITRLKYLNTTYCYKPPGKAVALTPAAECMLYWLGYRDIAVFIKELGVPPSPEDLQKAPQYAMEGAPILAAVVRGEALRVVDQFIQKAREGGVQPRVVIADFSKGCISVLEDVAAKISTAQITAQITTAATAAAAPQADWLLHLLLIVAAVIIIALLILLKMAVIIIVLRALLKRK
jgi:zinc/manganese transport system substrate-binding protein